MAEGQLTAERMGDGRAGSGRPPSWFGELAKRRGSRFGVVAASPVTSPPVRRWEPNRLNDTSCPLMLRMIGIGVFDLRPLRHIVAMPSVETSARGGYLAPVSHEQSRRRNVASDIRRDDQSAHGVGCGDRSMGGAALSAKRTGFSQRRSGEWQWPSMAPPASYPSMITACAAIVALAGTVTGPSRSRARPRPRPAGHSG